MYAGIVASFALLTLGSVQAIPTQHPASTANAIIDKRQIGETGQARDDWYVRPAEWDDLPPLPPNLKQAYERNAKHFTIALLTTDMVESNDEKLEMAKVALKNKMTYLTNDSARAIAVASAKHINDQTSAGVDEDSILDSLLEAMDVQTLEEEMAEFVRFRQEHERQIGPPVGLAPPFHSLTTSQDHQLILKKARSGGLPNVEVILEYLLSHDPFLVGSEEYAKALIWDTLVTYHFQPKPRAKMESNM